MIEFEDKAPTEEENLPPPTEEGSEDAPKDEGGDKLFAGKYKSAEELEKGYQELTAKLREKQPTAPEEYDFGEDTQVDLEDPRMKAVLPILKEHNVSNDTAKALAAAFIEAEKGSIPDPEKEKALLGDKADAIIGEVSSFFSRHARAMQLNEAEIDELKRMSATADGVKVLHKLVRRASAASASTVADGGSPANAESAEELLAKAQKLRSESKNFDMDPRVQKEYENLMTRYATLKEAKRS